MQAHANLVPSKESSERSALAAEVLRRAGRVNMRVRGESMLPALWPGDVVEIVSCSLPDVRPGDIVLAWRDSRFLLHRFVAYGTASGFVLCGDSMPGPDPPLPSEAFLGKLVRIVEAGLHVPAAALGRGWRGSASRMAGLCLCHWGAARRLALKLHASRIHSAKRVMPEAPVEDFGRADFSANANRAELRA